MTAVPSWLRLWPAGVVLALSTACAAGPSAAEQVPRLSTSLDRIDAAIADGDSETADTLLDELTAIATRAREGGRLEADQAARILDAADRLQSALPDQPAPAETTPAPEPSPSPTGTETETDLEQPDDEDEEDDSEAREDDPGKGKDKDKGSGKAKGRDD